ncbi:hypothetical protein GLAREA_07688 [Glarea lozoyensis ATCC 20868]|uniref:Uncharacterized protein n=1 Tax=Glarea lozoyensis (strain ATCC 20868 / MF5171) TaxID=1116229 RepID=S3D5Z6_GLAL2|nr:uncharacterized protein GLAREA_07688 [Glarea lozoyensis ATCC 20868]EPE32554.1 hypothetical protein GLAREA_07688 [Glarea lozoyensis ATCC 20868]
MSQPTSAHHGCQKLHFQPISVKSEKTGGDKICIEDVKGILIDFISRLKERYKELREKEFEREQRQFSDFKAWIQSRDEEREKSHNNQFEAFEKRLQMMLDTHTLIGQHYGGTKEAPQQMSKEKERYRAEPDLWEAENGVQETETLKQSQAFNEHSDDDITVEDDIDVWEVRSKLHPAIDSNLRPRKFTITAGSDQKQSAPTETSHAKRLKADHRKQFMPPPASATKRVSQSRPSMANTSFQLGTAFPTPVSESPRQNGEKNKTSQTRRNDSGGGPDSDESYDRLLPMVDERYRTVGNVTWCIGKSYFWNPASKSYTKGGGGEKGFTDRKVALRQVIVGMAKCVYVVRLGVMQCDDIATKYLPDSLIKKYFPPGEIHGDQWRHEADPISELDSLWKAVANVYTNTKKGILSIGGDMLAATIREWPALDSTAREREVLWDKSWNIERAGILFNPVLCVLDLKQLFGDVDPRHRNLLRWLKHIFHCVLNSRWASTNLVNQAKYRHVNLRSNVFESWNLPLPTLEDVPITLSFGAARNR